MFMPCLRVCVLCVLCMCVCALCVCMSRALVLSLLHVAPSVVALLHVRVGAIGEPLPVNARDYILCYSCLVGLE